MRIGISCYPTHGGSGIVATELGKDLAHRGHEVAFVSYSAPLRLTEHEERVSFHEVVIEKYPLLKQFPYTLALASKLVEVVRCKDLQLIHAHYAIPFGAAALLARQIIGESALKVVTTLHGTDITLVGNNASFKPVTKLAIEGADAVTAVSSFLVDETRREFDISRDIEMVYNFIDPRRHCPLSLADSIEKPTLVHISNFRSVKRIRDVVAIFARTCETVDARLTLVGEGPDTPVALQELTRLGLQDKARFVGVVDDVIPFIQQANILLLPSQTESFGLVALEAMACGLPVIASDVGGIPEVVEHERTGYLAPVGDVDAMASYATCLLTNNDLYNRISSAARKRAVTHFDQNQIVPQYEEIYKGVLGEAGSGA